MRGAVIALLALVGVIAWMRPPGEIHRVHTESVVVTQVPIALPIEHEVARVATTSCPAPSDKIVGTLRQPPEHVDSVHPSVTNAAWVAAWNAKHVFVSADGGTTWKRVLDGKGEVRDVGFDCFGRAIVLRENRVGIDEKWHAIAGLAAGDYVLGGGPDVVVLGDIPDEEDNHAAIGRLAIRRNGGSTWQYRDIAEHWESPVYGRQYEDGAIAAVLHEGDCAGQTPVVFTTKPDDITVRDSQLVSRVEIYGDFNVGEVEVENIDGYRRDIYAVEAPTPILQANGKAYRWVNDKAVELPWKLYDEANYNAGDRAGRLWGTACGRIVIASTVLPPKYCKD